MHMTARALPFGHCAHFFYTKAAAMWYDECRSNQNPGFSGDCNRPLRKFQPPLIVCNTPFRYSGGKEENKNAV